ncbi:MAG TPA: amidase [Flavitalea sp.]|nr:amidase [Flavitalea sp.]
MRNVSNQDFRQKMPRRQAINLIGSSTLSFWFSFGCTGNRSKLSSSELKSLHYKTLAEISELIKARKISCEELTQIILDRIAEIDKRLNSYLTVMRKEALADARVLDQELAQGTYRGTLHGVPIGVKDLLYTTNAPTTGGHLFNANLFPPYNATVVDRLHHAGAVILGKLNLTEGGMGGYNPTVKISKNPWGEDLWTGLSSSGSGVATAAGLCFGSVGTDTGGSIRFPSFANGIVGLKPTYGLVSRYGLLTLSESLDHVGPMTRSVLDAALMLEAMAGFDRNDLTSLQGDPPVISAGIKGGIKGSKIGIDHDYVSKGVDPALASSIETAVRKMEELGAIIVPFHIPSTEKEYEDAWFTIAAKEAYEAHKATYPSKIAEYGKFMADFLKIGSTVTAEKYEKAREFQKQFTMKFRTLLSDVNAFAAPAGGMAKGVTEQLWRANMSEGLTTRFWNEIDIRFGGAANLAGIPALTLPCGKAENGMPPPGFQLMGGALTEPMLCRIGYAYEEATGWSKQHPNI